MSVFINTADVLGDEIVEDMIIERTLEVFKDNRVRVIERSAFAYCTALTEVDLPLVTIIKDNAFENCNALNTLILRNETMCTMDNVNDLRYTPIANGTGYIYVPKALIEDYKVATNWATYTDQFRALEDYTVDGTITGELDESKI